MLTSSLYGEIADRSVREIFQRVAHLDLHPAATLQLDEQDLRSLVVTTRGDYVWTIALSAESAVLHQIAQNMKRGTPVSGEDELAAYTGEFFNILCGRLVSGINQAVHRSARFGIPVLLSEPRRLRECSRSRSMRDRFYEDGKGLTLRLRTLCDVI